MLTFIDQLLDDPLDIIRNTGLGSTQRKVNTVLANGLFVTEVNSVAIRNEWRYYSAMIIAFACRETELIFSGRFSRRLPHDIARIAERKLRLINRAISLSDLRIPPANRLEALKDDRVGQYSIRINDQWRICFTWNDGNVSDVEIVDYH